MATAPTATFTASDSMSAAPVYWRDCDAREILRELAGPGATDCGHVGADGDRSVAIACAIAEAEAGRPFHVLFEWQGIDSHVSNGSYSTGGGAVVFVQYDDINPVESMNATRAEPAETPVDPRARSMIPFMPRNEPHKLVCGG